MRCLISFLMLLFPFVSKGQDSLRREFAAGFGYGGILAHNQEVRYLAVSNPWQVNLEYRVLPTTSGMRKIPAYGAGIHYLDYRSDVLGSTLGLFGFAEPTLFGPIVFRIGCGIGWNSKPYNLQSNPTNIMLGSVLSGMMQARISAFWQVNPKIRWNYGVGLTHFSNGAWSHPNKGINCYYLFCNAGFTGKSIKKQRPFATMWDSVANALHTSIAASGSLTERYPFTGKKYIVWQIQGRIEKQLGFKSRFSAGIDLMHNNAVESILKEEPETGASAVLWGITAGHSWFILPFTSILSEFGYYLYRENSFYPAMYQRYGLRYHVGKRMAAGVLLKTHLARAECLEFNLQYRLGR